MARTAEYSIKGYLYQFLKYLSEILAAGDGARITIEGAIEDVDVIAAGLTTAVQCKYHEQAEKYTLGKIYKPILLMLEHFSKNSGTDLHVSYRLFCHFPGESGTKALTKDDLETVLSTKGEVLRAIVARIDTSVDYEAFLDRFAIEFGPSAEDLQVAVLASLKDKGFDPDDIDAVIFPNAIQRIVDLATRSDVNDRTVEPKTFLAGLREVRRVTFTRWTRELATKGRMFSSLRKSLRSCLAHNSRWRVFVINPLTIENFDDDIVRFIKAFVQRYSSKYLHSNPPLFMLTGDYDLSVLQKRLYDAGLRCETGKVGGTDVIIKELFRRPILIRNPFRMEFSLRLAKRDEVIGGPQRRPDELFLINVADDEWKHEDVNVHGFKIERLSDLEYILQLRSDYA
ncbi:MULTISPECIES: hypothetical protein [Rhizobium/Agrobacterium group]|uniref:Restriction endonuclease n=1 Tax=Agrobacterium tumefaciens TaxID=358 RepID=A0ABF7SXE0_AGRTU|nr:MULTISPECIES: hypothetical protein [Rhizobium/Agrobacterium group]AHK04653.1 hypothetical protein X971_4814 [Agrobacterium tumefaciens LBA4213 (Ach5)]AKC10383.1 hypothetical protein Ach5_46120 [Agrobacterium tumefaciens]AYM19529.1 hypothetical protein At15955_45440 [Agrobacterium tumefaciens]AYM70830.1 hypothetical protein AtA6_46140 [Agrobacterium tumefaciens]NIB59454.1 hypothetical protein [Agrobacterium tumefaciens]